MTTSLDQLAKKLNTDQILTRMLERLSSLFVINGSPCGLSGLGVCLGATVVEGAL